MDTNGSVQLEELNSKLDVILAEIEQQKRRRREMEDLKDDLTRVGNDLFQHAIVELEEVHDHLRTGDILHLFKKLLRNVNNISRMFDQLENARDFLDDFSPVFRDMAIDSMQRLDDYDRKGYFEFINAFTHIMDNIVTSFTVEDVRQLGDNIVAILNTVKNLTQPDMLQAANNFIGVYKNMDFDVPDNISLYSLLRELKSPEARKGLAISVAFLKNLAAQGDGSTTTGKQV